MELASVVLILYLFKFTCVYASTNVGREFIFVFMENIINSSQLDVYISTRHPTPVKVQISAPLIASSRYPHNITVTSASAVRVTLDKNLALKFSARWDNGVLVSSDADITVQCFSTSTSTTYTNSIGGYLALPTHVLGTEYMIATFCERNSCLFAVVGTADSTMVSICFKLPPSGKVVFEKMTYRNGDIINITINRYEAVQMLAVGSLTGTNLRATAKIAVFVGSDYTSAVGLSMDHLVEQLPPIDSWGMDYLLIPFPKLTSYDLVLVTAVFQQTSIKYMGSKYIISESGGSINLRLYSGKPSRLWSDKRIIVMQICTSFNSYTEYTDPAMLLVPPAEQWVPTYLFVSPLTRYHVRFNVLTLVAASNCSQLLQLTTQTNQIPLTWTGIVGTEQSVSYTRLTQEGPYLVASVPGQAGCLSVGGYIYGPGYHSAWTMPIGQAFLSLPEKRDVVASTSTPVDDSTSLKIKSSSVKLESSSNGVLDMSITASPSVVSSSLATTRLGVPSSLLSSVNSTDSMDSSYLQTPVTPSVGDDFSLLQTTVTPSVSVVDTSTLQTLVYPGVSGDISSLQNPATLSFSVDTSPTQSPGTPSVKLQASPMGTSSSRSPVCTCSCKVTRTATDVSSKIDEIQRNLTVEKKNLSSRRRKKHSAVDHRSSSLTIGLFGILFVSLTFMLVTASDVVQAMYYLLSAYNAERVGRLPNK